ncbi:Pr6Pr family membrane protein [Parapedobacter tibetensis]|uniref:Pr6Pr family membrane protein n=1 Tax=Parapedobacter tibetensis TaxID=2972951 RepID=UPI00214D78C8|nr:Pr6Pr family membrane protein [Parapedobacter tibetensis]
MRRNLSILFAIIAWFAVLTQYYLMIENRVVSIGETTIRFFSFFTILTNSLVAIYFTLILFKIKSGFLAIINKPGTLTAITVYITIVALVYQIILRHIWQPTGLQMVVDELLHTLIPIMVIIYWYLYKNNSLATYKQIPKWLIYPAIYLLYILIRGKFSDFYPYPFVDVGNLGLSKVLINSVLLISLFVGLSAIFISVERRLQNK